MPADRNPLHKSMMKHLISGLCLLFIVSAFSVTLAQNKGVIQDTQTKEPLPGVSVSLTANTQVVAVSGEDGTYSIPSHLVPKDNDSIRFSHIGYTTLTIPFSELKEKNFIIDLSEDTQALEAVTVSGRAEPQISLKYETMRPMKIPVYGFGAVIADGKIYVVGGDETETTSSIPGESGFNRQSNSNRMQIYDIETDTWTVSDLRFTRRAYHNVHHHDGKLFILGGKRLAKNPRLEYLNENIEIYDIQNDTLITDKNNPHQAVNFASVVFDNNILAMGGSIKLYRKEVTETKRYSNKAHLLDLNTGYWYELDNMPKAKETKGIVVGNTIYTIGGHRQKSLKEICTYNIGSGEWTVEGELPEIVERPALAHNEDIIYIFEKNRIYTYNLQTKTLNTYRINLSMMFSEMFCYDGMLYIMGGVIGSEPSQGFIIDTNRTLQPISEVYRVDLNEFKKTKIVED